jgi:hypothetical protein
MPDLDSSNNQTPRTTTDRDESLSDRLREAALQADTVARHASNLLSFGLADKVEAAGDALFEQNPGDWLQRFKAALKDQATRNLYDASHRQFAGLVGDGVGIGLATYGAGLAGAEGSAALPIRIKGQLGEGLSAAKTVVQGDWPVQFQARKIMQNNRYTVLDHETAKGTYVEAKFGPRARLTPNQQFAQRQWGPGYRVDYWMPRHVGYITAPTGAASGLLSWGMQQPSTEDQDPSAQ